MRLDGYEFVGLTGNRRRFLAAKFWPANHQPLASVGKVALAFVATIEAALAKAADAFLKSLALLVARQHHRLR